MTEVNIHLNVHEIGIMLQCLQGLSLSEEKLLAKNFGSAHSLYSRLHDIWSHMDHSSLQFNNDLTPSF